MLNFVSTPPIDLSSSKSRTNARPQTGRATSGASTTTVASAASQSEITTVPTVLARTAIALEYASLRHDGHCPLGMYVTPSPESLLVWDAIFFVHQGAFMSTCGATWVYAMTLMTRIGCAQLGYYADSILKFRLTFPPNYPERPPVVQFLTDVFHPLVSQQDGTFNLAPRFHPWRCVTMTQRL